MDQGFKIFFVIMFFICGTTELHGQVNTTNKDTLGLVTFPVTCISGSQPDFTRAMILLHHMTYPQAREQFQSIIASDSTCSMAYWGVAMTLFQPLWPTRPGLKDLQQGWEVIQKAQSFHALTERERLLIAATAEFFREPDSSDYWKRVHAWADGMEKAYKAFPKDHEIAVLYALSLLAIIPPDLTTSPNNARAAEILLGVLKENPQHPGAMHYLIHANDVRGREFESLDILKRYEAIAPQNPHALHMPTHIYTRLGDWRAVIRGNLKAADAALEFPAGDQGQFVWDEFPHAIEYLIYAYLQIGADDEAAEQLKRLQGIAQLEPTFKTAFHLSSTKARYTLERKAWSEAAAIIPREPNTVDWDRFPWPEAVSWFARGLGRVHLGDSSEARTSLSYLMVLETRAINAKEILFARNIRIFILELSAWITDMEGMRDSSITLMKQAADLEASSPKHPVTPAATLPAYELLGDLLLSHGDSQNALKAYQLSLEMYPQRLNSLFGAAQASSDRNDTYAAKEFYLQIIKMADMKSKRQSVKDAWKFLSK